MAGRGRRERDFCELQFYKLLLCFTYFDIIKNMNISLLNKRLNVAVKTLTEMGAKRIILFGSMVESPEKAHDVDIAVEGIPLNRILEADVKIHEVLQTPIDLISREESPVFFDIVKDYGRVLYEKG